MEKFIQTELIMKQKVFAKFLLSFIFSERFMFGIYILTLTVSLS